VIRHVFVGTVRDGVSEKDVDRLVERWRGLPREVPGIRSFSAGRNVSTRDHRYSVAVVADFDDIAGWELWMEHPSHLAVGAELTNRIIDPQSRAMVQLEL
jgi:hypothetical protein